MKSQLNHSLQLISLLAALCLLTPPLDAQQNLHENLQVLPQNISRQSLNRVMVENLQGLGLPRRQSEGCLFCHEGNMDVPAAQWDYASDAKLNKRKARDMMAMVQDINSRLQNLEARVAPDFEVSCATCHAGRTDPRPLPAVLLSTYRSEGIANTLARYESLRQRYFGGDAYDFRFNTLVSVATTLSGENHLEDAIAIARLNESVFEQSTQALSFTLTLQVEQVIRRDGLDAGLDFFARQRRTTEHGDVGSAVLDALGWQYYRSGRQPSALQIFRNNQESFADDYIANESLADALWFTEESEARQESLAIFSAWLEQHPDHAMARRRLATLRSQEQ